MTPDLSTLLGFLKWVLTAGGTGVVLFFILEKVPVVDEWFAALTPKMKRVIVLFLALMLPLGATGLGVAFNYMVLTEDLIYAALRVGIEVFASSQIAHLTVVGRKRIQ